MKKIIDRYILKEIAFPFFMILFILTFVLLMGKILQLMDLMVNKGIRVTDIALLIIYLMPSFLLFTIPISLFVAIMMGLGRLSGDNELLVMKAAGMSLYRLARPVFVAVGACFLLTALTSYYLAPHGNFAVKSLLFDLARDHLEYGDRFRSEDERPLSRRQCEMIRRAFGSLQMHPFGPFTALERVAMTGWRRGWRVLRMLDRGWFGLLPGVLCWHVVLEARKPDGRGS